MEYIVVSKKFFAFQFCNISCVWIDGFYDSESGGCGFYRAYYALELLDTFKFDGKNEIFHGRNSGSFDEFKGRALSWLFSQLEKIKWQRLKAFSCHVYSTAKFAKWAVSVCRSACLFLSWRTWLRRNYHGYGVSSFCFIPRFFNTVIIAKFDRFSLLFRRRNFSRFIVKQYTIQNHYFSIYNFYYVISQWNPTRRQASTIR